MRIAYVCLDPGVPIFGRKGCSIHAQAILRVLRRRGHEIAIFAVRRGVDAGGPEGQDAGGPEGQDAASDLTAIPFHLLRVEENGRTHDNAAPSRFGRQRPGTNGRAARELATIKANEELFNLLRREGPFDLVYERHSLFSDSAMRYARRQFIPSVLEINAPLIEEQRRRRYLAHEQEAQTMARRAFAQAHTLIAVSEEIARCVKRIPECRRPVHVISNGVDVERFASVASAERLPQNGFTIGFVGSLKPWHGVSSLIDAFQIVKQHAANARLLIVGEGPEREALETRARSHRLTLGVSGSVEFTGAVPHKCVTTALGSMDVAVAPYPEMNAFYFSPLKVYEYMAASRAIVASRIGEIPTLIRHETHGLLYPPSDTSALADRLLQLHADPQLARRLGQAARTAVAARHSWDAKVDRILKLALRSQTSIGPKEEPLV